MPPNANGRPRAFDMNAVLDAAMTLFWEQGYEATSLTQLRTATGLSSASLYGAFGSKEVLFERAVAHYIAGPGNVTEAPADEHLAPEEALAKLLHGSIDMQTDPAHPQGCLIALSATVGPLEDRDASAYAAVTVRRAADRERIASCLRRGITNGTFRATPDVDAIALLVHSYLLGISTQIRDEISAPRLHQSADALLAMLTSAPAPPAH